MSRLLARTVTVAPRLIRLPQPCVAQTVNMSTWAAARMDMLRRSERMAGVVGLKNTPHIRTFSQLPEKLPPSLIHMPSGLMYQDLEVGTGPVVKSDDTVTVRYTTSWVVGDKILNHLTATDLAPITFQLEGPRSSQGLCEAIVGMKVGSTRLLVLPRSLSAGALGREDVAPQQQAEQVVQVQVLGVQQGADKVAEGSKDAGRLGHLFGRNRIWAEAIKARDPDFFTTLSKQQSPEYLWIGCSDSRVPANQIVSLLPGELFVHRNVANVVVHTDLNCLSVMQFAIDVLKVKHIIVCGHYGCGGVRTAHTRGKAGIVDNWIRHVVDVDEKHHDCVHCAHDLDSRVNVLCELNVIEQAHNVCRTTFVRDAWERGHPLTVHSWIYGLHDGLLRDLGMAAQSTAQANKQYQEAVDAVHRYAKQGVLRPPGVAQQ